MVESVEPATMVVARDALTRVPPKRSEALEAWQRRCSARGLGVYAADRFNFVAPKTDDPTMTWTALSMVEAFGSGAQHALA